MYSNNIMNFQASTPILNAHTKTSGNLSYAPRIIGIIFKQISFSDRWGLIFTTISSWIETKNVYEYVVYTHGFSKVKPNMALSVGL